MTHPNVEYFRARAEIIKGEIDKANLALVGLMNETEDEKVLEVLSHANVRLSADMIFIKKLVQRIEDYEERIALLQ